MSGSSVSTGGSQFSTSLVEILQAEDIQPGAEPSYHLCKLIYMYHPLGGKIAEAPIRMAQSQLREIAVPDGPEEVVRKAFVEKAAEIHEDAHIFNLGTLSRVYGLSSVVIKVEGEDPSTPLDLENLYKKNFVFSVFDPLNMAGSINVMNQDPNAMDFLRTTTVQVQGQIYHVSRVCVQMNENPIYLGYTNSAFGYVGRSVYQRSLYPLKTFIESMRTDDLVVRKVGVLIAKIKAPGSIVDNLMARVAGFKRRLLKEAETTNVISIDVGEEVESLDLHNLEGPYELARRHCLENIAASDDMPAKILNQETFAEGFGEGTEDAKTVVRYVERKRAELDPAYRWFDRIVMRLAWTPDFYETIQRQFEAYRDVPYQKAFYEWANSFSATWPSLLTEPESEKIKVDDVRLKAMIAVVQVLLPELDPENKTILVQWISDNLNTFERLFDSPLLLDYEALEEHAQEAAEAASSLAEAGDGAEEDGRAPPAPRPFSSQDALAGYDDSVRSYLDEVERRRAKIREDREIRLREVASGGRRR